MTAKEMKAKVMKETINQTKQGEAMETLIESTEVISNGTVQLSEKMAQRVELLNTIGQFTRVNSVFEEKFAKDVKTGEEVKYNVLTLPNGEKRNVFNSEAKSIIEQAITVNALEKGASVTKYVMLWKVDKKQAWKSIAGCKSIGDFAKEVLGIEKGTATDYLDTLRTFYTMDEEGKVDITNEVFEGVSLSNLKEMKAVYKSDPSKLVKAIMDGEVHPELSQTKVRAEVKALNKELPKQDNKKEEPKQGNKEEEPKQDNKQEEPKQDNKQEGAPIEKDPKAEAIRLNDMGMGYALEVCKENKEKCDKLVDLYNQIAILLDEC